MTKRIQNLAPSKTMAVTAKSKELKAQGIRIYDYSVGEPDFVTPENIREAAKRALDEGHTKYTLVNGILELREAIAKKLWEDNGLVYSPENIVVGTGAKQPLFEAVFTVCEEGDEVLIPVPAWVSYEEIVKLSGAEPVFVQTDVEHGFALDIDAIEKAITEKTKAIILNTPNNPTGAVYSEESLRKLAGLALKHHFYIIVDEIYEKLIYNEEKHFSVASISKEVQDICLVLNGFSKAYAMTGWRVGYVAANTEIIKGIKSLQSHMTSASNSIAQYAALEALNGSQKFISDMRKAFTERRQFILDRVKSIPFTRTNVVGGAFYMMLDITEAIGKKYHGIEITNSMQLAEMLLTQKHVAFVSGAAFHAEGFLRMCYAVSMEEISGGLDAFAEFMNELE